MRRRLFRSLLLLLGSTAAGADPFILPPVAEAEPVITVNQPSGTGPSLNGTGTFDGVARLLITKAAGSFTCSGSLLLSGRHILTAAHCANGLLGAQATFLGTTTQSISVLSALVFPGYNPLDVTDPRDIAILTLGTEVFGYSRYDIYRGSSEVGQVGTLVGYGREGDGTGSLPGSSGTRRQANNFIDGIWSYGSLAFDFDNFSPDNLGNTPPTTIDPFGTCYASPQTGVAGEGMIAPGDSGGPLFLAGLVAGVHSWGGTDGPDCGDTYLGVDGNGQPTYLDSSWGEVAGDVRVSDYSDWIDSFMVPEPSTFFLLGFGLAGVGVAARRKNRQPHN
jgi:hypothetical protein